jgi:Ca-activated chloride channel family protein
VLLTDGLANEGITDSGVIAAAVAEAARKGIATSAMGIGEDYNETLLEAISRAGDGSYYYVEEADQLPGLFEAELKGFKAVVGRQVTLAILPGPGIELVGILNEFPVSASGAPQLPNLVAGARPTVGFTLRALTSLSARPGDEVEVCVVQVAWNDAETGERLEVRHSVRLPIVTAAGFEALSVDPVAAEKVALLRSARAKREAMLSVDQGDLDGISQALARAWGFLKGLPNSPALEKEQTSLSSLEKDLAEGRLARLRKNAHFESHSRSYSDDAIFEGHINRKVILIAAQNMRITQGDLALVTADALVNSRSGKGLDEHLRATGGPVFRAESEALGPFAVGSVGVTGGGILEARHVLHACVPDWMGGTSGEVERLAALYRACFDHVLQTGAVHVAFPLLGAGGRGYPLDVAVQVAVVSAATFLFQNRLKHHVTFVTRDKKAVAALESMIQNGYVER